MTPIINYVLTMLIVVFNWSMLSRDNIFYQFAHHVYLGVAVSTVTLVAIEAVTKTAIRPIMSGSGKTWLLVPIIFGLIIFLNQTRNYSWVSRYPLQAVLGIGVALGMRGALDADIIQQIGLLIRMAKVTNPWDTFNAFLAIIIALTAFYYFFFHFVHKTPGHKTISKIGRLGIMANFGVGLAGYMMFNATFILFQIANLIFIAPPPGQQIEAAVAAIATVAVLGILYWAVPKYIFPRLSEETRKTL